MKYKRLLNEFVKIRKRLDLMERLIIDANGTEKSVPVVFKESLKNPNMERILFIPDIHIPDENKKALKVVLDFITDFKPTSIYLLGDVLNFSRASDFLIVGGKCPTLGDEIRAGRAFLYDFMEKVNQLDKKPEIFWLCGNHEFRLEKFLAKTGDLLTDVNGEDGEQMVSIPGIFGLKKLGIQWIPYYDLNRKGNLIIEHGKIVRGKAGYTATAQLEKYGKSGFSGHTHRIGFIAKSFGGGDEVKFWTECGTLSNLVPTPRWGPTTQDWANGFAVAIYDRKSDITYPMPILMQNNSFWFGEHIYK